MNNHLPSYNHLLKDINSKNGVDHDIIFYDPHDFVANRKGQHYLANENANPMIVIPQSSPLSVREFTKPEAVFGLVNICVEDGTKNIDFLPNYENYERIIVSRIYAEAAKSILQIIFHIWIVLLLRFHYTIKSQKHSMI